MNQMYMRNQGNFKGRSAVVALSIISLAFTLVGFFVVFLTPEFNYSYYGGYSSSGLEFYFPGIFVVLTAMFNLAPAVLFTVYMLGYQRKGRCNGLYNASFAVVACSAFMGIIQGNNALVSLIGYILVIASFGLATIFARNERYGKAVVIVATALGMLDRFVALYNCIEYMDVIESYYGYGGLDAYFAMLIIAVVGMLLVYVSLLIYGVSDGAIYMSGYNPMYGGMPNPNMQYGGMGMQDPYMQYGGMQMPNPNMQYGGAPMQDPNMQYGGMQAPNPNMQYGGMQAPNPNMQYGGMQMPTTEQMLADLDNRMRNGMISPEEYYRRRDEILGGYGR